MAIDSASFKDPFGAVFHLDGHVLRSIFKPGLESYEAAKEKGVFDRLIDKGLLVSQREVDIPVGAPSETVLCLEHPRLPFVSYPWEWTFGMLKDAALLHLEIMKELLPKGFWLRDASAFNAQYDGERLRLIDTLSIGPRIPDSPWVAYGQFCSHFLAPLALATYCDLRTLGLWRSFIDGIPLELAVRLLPSRARLKPGLLMHLFLHARYQKRAQDAERVTQSSPPKATPKVSDRALIGLIRSLKNTIAGLCLESKNSLWNAYEDIRTYKDADLERKANFVRQALEEVHPTTVWDLGANRGEFSSLAAGQGAFTVAIEGDPACTEYIYRERTPNARPGGLLPLHMDLANPSPDLGWDGSERLGLGRRAPADMLLSLAIIHHLVLTNYIPMQKLAAWMASLGKHLVVEYIPPTDPMVQKLLENRHGEHLPYDWDSFESSFGRYFEFVRRLELENERILLLGLRR